MKKSKTIYLDTLSKWVVILFGTQIYLFATQGLANLSRGIQWFAISQFVLAGGLFVFLIIHYLLTVHCGNRYIHFDETGVEIKNKYFENKTYLHWDGIERVRFEKRKILISLKENGSKPMQIKFPYEKFEEIKEDFIQFMEPMNIVIEQQR
jgi:hypothetical protein